MHPGRGELEVFDEFLPLIGRERMFQVGTSLRRHMLFSQLAEGLDQKTAQSPGSRHVARSSPPELDCHRPDLHCPARPICQEHRLCWHLLGQPQSIRRIGSRWLQAGAITASQGAGYHLGRWRQQSELGVFPREIVHSAREAADDPLPNEPVKGDINRLSAANIQKIRRNEDRTASTAMNGRNYP